jgi:hypothetical protein
MTHKLLLALIVVQQCCNKTIKQKEPKFKLKSKTELEFELKFLMCNQITLGTKSSPATPTKTRAQQN